MAEWIGAVASVATLLVVGVSHHAVTKQLKVLEGLYREINKVTPGE